MTKLKRLKLSDLYSMSSGISSKPEQAGHGAPFLSFRTVFHHYFIPKVLNELMDSSDKEQEIHSIKKGDIFLTRTSEILDELGMSCVALEDYPKATFSGFLKRFRPIKDNLVYDKYIGFYLRSPIFRKSMTNNATMTLRASLNKEIASYLDLYLPDYESQKNIGDFLFSINSKIALNNQINAELEAMSKTLYDYWFVQFNFPDENGRPYKTSGGKMVYNHDLKQEIPEKWTAVKLKELIHSEKSGDWGQGSTLDDFTKKVRCIRGADIEAFNTSGECQPPVRYIQDTKAYKFLIKGDIVIEISGGSPQQSTGRMTLIEPESLERFDSPLICSNFCKSISLKNQKLIYNFRFFWNQLYDNDIFFGYEGKTSGIKNLLFQSLVQSIYLAIPDEKNLNQFYQLIRNIQHKIQCHLAENKELTQLRDWLLPMLMNGQVSVQ